MKYISAPVHIKKTVVLICGHVLMTMQLLKTG